MFTIALISAGIAAAGLGYQIYSGMQNDKRADKAAKLQKGQMKQQAKDQLMGAKQAVSDIESQISQTTVDIAEAQSKISGFQSFLDRFGDYYQTKTTQAQAGIAELEMSGKQAYENLMQTLGYTDALAGATGRAGAGTSMAQVGELAKQNVIDYVGADMTLDQTGGLYGLQRTSAGLSYDQLLLDLQAEHSEAEAQKGIWGTSLVTLEKSKASMENSLAASKQRVSELDAWIQETF